MKFSAQFIKFTLQTSDINIQLPRQPEESEVVDGLWWLYLSAGGTELGCPRRTTRPARPLASLSQRTCGFGFSCHKHIPSALLRQMRKIEGCRGDPVSEHLA